MFPSPNKFISVRRLSLSRSNASHASHITRISQNITSIPCSPSTMVAPPGGAGQRVRPPLAPATTRHKKKNTAPATVTKTPARGIRSSPRHTQSTNAAASALTNLAERARNSNSATPSYPVITSLFDDNNDTQYEELQALLSPEAPVAEVLNTGRRVVQSQLTASTGLGDDFLLSSSDEEEEKEDELVVEDDNIYPSLLRALLCCVAKRCNPSDSLKTFQQT